MKHLQLLKQYWGYDHFRGKQQEIIESVGNGIDTLAIMPTGAGKSLCYQIPALMSEGLTLVISPLIALMADQVDGLRKRGIRSTALMGNLTHHEVLYILEQAEFGAYDLLYLSPERLMSSLFRKRLPFLNITLIAVDEAHCISQWGYDFRPHYLRIAELRDFYPKAPIVALTASATTLVIEDICDKLKLQNPSIIKGDFSRPNLVYLTRHVESKATKLLEIVRHINGSCIIYVRYREHCQKWAKELTQNGFTALPYHAGMNSAERKKNQDLWMSNQCRIIVATSAFGMGVDKPDVRSVIHIEMPDSLEAYYQEAGRAGRDGEKAFAILLEEDGDDKKMVKRTKQSFPPREYIREIYQHIANFYTVGVHSGAGAVFPFNIIDFSTACKVHGPSAMAAIKFLEMGDYITLIEDIESPSKLRITVSRDRLYSTTYPNKIGESIVECLLRMYTGILNDFVHINEDKLATKLNLTRETIYSTLVHLDKCDIVKYIPFKKTPLLIYNQDRVPNEEIYIPKIAYEDRMERTLERTKSMLHYLQQEDICRERVIMQYFDVDNKKDCGHCDICIKRRHLDKPTVSRDSVRSACINILNENSILAYKIVDEVMNRLNISFQERKQNHKFISTTIRELLEEELITFNGTHISINKELL